MTVKCGRRQFTFMFTAFVCSTAYKSTITSAYTCFIPCYLYFKGGKTPPKLCICGSYENVEFTFICTLNPTKNKHTL